MRLGAVVARSVEVIRNLMFEPIPDRAARGPCVRPTCLDRAGDRGAWFHHPDRSLFIVLGLGIPEPYPSWGRMLSESAAEYVRVAPWLVIFPGIAISLAVFGTNLFGDALRDILDPRQRG